MRVKDDDVIGDVGPDGRRDGRGRRVHVDAAVIVQYVVVRNSQKPRILDLTKHTHMYSTTTGGEH